MLTTSDEPLLQSLCTLTCRAQPTPCCIRGSTTHRRNSSNWELPPTRREPLHHDARTKERPGRRETVDTHLFNAVVGTARQPSCCGIRAKLGAAAFRPERACNMVILDLLIGCAQLHRHS